MSKYIKKITATLCGVSLLLTMILPGVSKAATTYTQSVRSGIDAFPADYQVYLRKLQETHPNWNFDAYYTGISWNDLVANETDCGHNRIINSANSLWKSSCGNVASGYACASEGITKYYLDPRNFINSDIKVFQFLEISYNEKIHTVDGVKGILKNTFMKGDVTFWLNGEQRTMSYAQIIVDAARASQMSPYSIATKIIQEVGSNGSKSVTGDYPGYEGYYNFYNYDASDGGSPIAKGLQYAKNHGWNNQYTAIVEGAKLLANSYTNAGQNTAYFYKWDVVGNTILKAGQTSQVSSSYLFRHQYMTNIQDPTSQASSTYRTFANNGIIDSKLNFVIPVYDNMPTSNKLPTKLTTADGALYYMTDTSVRVRSEPNTNCSVLGVMNTLDEIVAVIERECSVDSTGRRWDKVKISNGTVGYIASEYLAPCNAVEVKKAKIEGSNIITIPNLTGAEMANTLGITNYEVKKNGSKIENSAKLGTSYVVKDITNNKEYTIVVKGDANGDGEVKATDYMRVKNFIMGTSTLSETEKKAADVNGDGEVKATDYMKIKNYIMGVSSITI